MDGEKQLGEFKITQEERDKALIDALEIKNTLLIQIALSIGANPLKGGGKLLVYASEQGNLELLKQLIPTINLNNEVNQKYLEEATIKATQKSHKEILKTMFPDALPAAINAAVKNDLYEMAIWILSQGAVMHIDDECVKRHLQTLNQILCNYSEVRIKVEKKALFATLSMYNSSEVLDMLLNAVKREEPEHFNKWLLLLAEECVETDRVDCMKVIVKHGANVKGISTRYCQNGDMRKFMEEHGAYMW